jgi:hypothetical protein
MGFFNKKSDNRNLKELSKPGKEKSATADKCTVNTEAPVPITNGNSIDLADPELMAEKLLVEVNKGVNPEEIPLPDSIQIDQILKVDDPPQTKTETKPATPAVSKKENVAPSIKGKKTASLGNLDDIFNMADEEVKSASFELAGVLPEVSIEEVVDELNSTIIKINRLRRK